MLDLKESTALEHLRKMAVYFDADLIENYGVAILKLNNKRGKGFISSYDVFPGLSVRVYNITFSKAFKIDMELSKQKPLYFSYMLKGHIKHKFAGEESFETLEEKKNVVIWSDPGINSQTIFPAGVKLEMSAIILNKDILANNKLKRSRPLESNLEQIFKKIEAIGPYRYLGEINPDSAEYARIIARNERTDIMGRLMTEGAVMNLLFKQLEAYDEDSNNNKGKKRAGLNDKELKICTNIGEYLQNNIGKKITIKNLSDHFNLRQPKLQQGVRYLFGVSLNKYMLYTKLAYAKELLQNSDQSVLEVAKTCGFKSPSYFSKMFKERYEYYPNNYRRFFQSNNALFEITYRSKAVSKLTESEIENLVLRAMEYNSQNDITGCLIHYRGHFFQIIEGPKKKLFDLYARIEEDRRHTKVKILWKGAKFMRNFGLWSMALVTDKGDLRVTYEDKLDSVNLGKVLNEIKSSNELSDVLWRKVRNVIKTASDVTEKSKIGA